ncbi:MAG: phosphatidylserine decarboxylase family protein [Anaerolineae bacterium]|nr:phosphatidylserine decarboxylase family protein [Anaerolineae bacterium]
MKIHREGFSILAFAAGAMTVFVLLVPRRLRVISGFLVAIILGFLTQFFRNPDRTTPPCEDCVISPADGVVVGIERVMENEYFHEERLRVSIFMRVIDVHVNRVPVSGRLIYYRYHPGAYLMAFHPKSSELNEHNTIVIERTDGQPILMRQIAGILARRICFYLQEEQTVEAGQELGFIKFGSRCDIFLPLDAQIDVQLQQAVKGGETILARF